MYEKPRVNVKVEPRSTFTFTQGSSVIMVSFDKKICSIVFFFLVSFLFVSLLLLLFFF